MEQEKDLVESFPPAEKKMSAFKGFALLSPFTRAESERGEATDRWCGKT